MSRVAERSGARRGTRFFEPEQPASSRSVNLGALMLPAEAMPQ